MRSSPSRNAFTLLELMAVLAIMATLCVVVFGVSRRLRASQQQTTCLSNLRQIGLGITLYVQDNQYRLPGPLWRGQSPLYQADAEGQFDTASGNLSSFLAPYLHFETLTPGSSALAALFTCPAWHRSAAGQTICYYSAGELTLPNAEAEEEAEPIFPFGRSGGDPVEPSRLNALPHLANTPAFWEFDRRLATEGFYITDPRVPSTPVHQSVRNILYFDGHVVPSEAGPL